MIEGAPVTGRALERPTSAAELTFSLGPTAIEGKAVGIVPAGEAHTLITTFGMIMAGVAGIAGAAATVAGASPRTMTVHAGLALAELVLALAVVLLISRRDPGQTGRAIAGCDHCAQHATAQQD